MRKKNTQPQLANYFHSRGKALGMPVSASFELTARCNFNCPMCYVHLTPEQVEAAGRELTAQEWIQLAREARDRGLIFALLTGGEPLVRKDFFEIYKGMKELGLVISINSNGSMLQGEILEKFLEDPPSRFNISLYGGSNETYRNMCGIPAYDRVKENIRALRQAGVDVSLNLSITPYNCQDLAQIYADAVELDVNVRASSYMYPPVRVNDEAYGCGNRLSPTEAAQKEVEWDRIRFSDEEFAFRANNIIHLAGKEQEGCPLEEGEGITCRAGSTSLWVTWDGKMTPCGMMTGPVVYPVRDGFSAAWDALRAETDAIRMPAQCSTCDHKDVCSVCAAVSFTETGRYDGLPTYICEKTREMVRITREHYEEIKRNDHQEGIH